MGGDQFVLSFVRRHLDFWLHIIVKGHPLRGPPVWYSLDGVNLHDLLLREYRGPLSNCPYDVGRFPGAVFRTRIPPMFTGFVDDEGRALANRVP